MREKIQLASPPETESSEGGKTETCVNKILA